jgi:hypothetical protein
MELSGNSSDQEVLTICLKLLCTLVDGVATIAVSLKPVLFRIVAISVSDVRAPELY